MTTTSPEDLAGMLMQIAHAIDMVNHLPDPASWSTEQLASFPITDNDLRLLRHGANEAWAINGDRHGVDAREADSAMSYWRRP